MSYKATALLKCTNADVEFNGSLSYGTSRSIEMGLETMLATRETSSMTLGHLFLVASMDSTEPCLARKFSKESETVG